MSSLCVCRPLGVRHRMPTSKGPNTRNPREKLIDLEKATVDFFRRQRLAPRRKGGLPRQQLLRPPRLLRHMKSDWRLSRSRSLSGSIAVSISAVTALRDVSFGWCVCVCVSMSRCACQRLNDQRAKEHLERISKRHLEVARREGCVALRQRPSPKLRAIRLGSRPRPSGFSPAPY